ncbi:DUF1887 family CARF protein [Brasilonema sp. UFV-L1]|uniref:Card1-like endonuclease domain-containing protein n=1 Tax=Brasilonema sp. UFV-L1 TaxID=2234130 RepID=UPI00145F08BC|nr:DUF1887 family CARF protein [Brasilonema sp. UFV-L1]NMG08855.1 DUF1887 domain-containing protein [Brasilonema sp. UFV-L1]
MSTSEFDKYKVDHLFLLIGENPLPNYIAAKLLLNEGGTVYLVHTAGTVEQAKRLQNILSSERNGLKAELRSLNDYESDAYYIQKEIGEKLKSIKSGKIGLNYTGGTKAMSTHAYRILFYEEVTDRTYKQRADIIFSYLDPRRLEMCIDREDNERVRLKIKPDTLQVKLVKIFQLHGLELKQNPTEQAQQAQLPQLATELANVFKEETKSKQWFDWFYNVFREQTYKQKSNGGGDWKSKTSLMEVSISLEKLPQEIVAAFKQENFVTPDAQLSLQEVQKTGVFKEVKSFCKWLDGIWLEHYVLEQVKKIAHSQLITDYGLNFEIPLTGTRDGFEFDVAFTRGYQLFAISCTTTDKRGTCKLKLFEAYLRAKQMGGDEARVALICCSGEPDTLKAEMTETLAKNKIAVFGREDLVNLSKKITEWIVQNDREAK